MSGVKYTIRPFIPLTAIIKNKISVIKTGFESLTNKYKGGKLPHIRSYMQTCTHREYGTTFSVMEKLKPL
jgi:hypothetical protein